MSLNAQDSRLRASRPMAGLFPCPHSSVHKPGLWPKKWKPGGGGEVEWGWDRKCEGPPQEAKWPLPGLFFSFAAFSLCHYRKTTRRSSTFPQPFQKGERVDGAAVGRPILLLYFPRSCSSQGPPTFFQRQLSGLWVLDVLDAHSTSLSP